MRIERIEIDGFGRFHDAHWQLREGLTVLVGANEAGKTTLLNALRALLFGFESSRNGRTWYPRCRAAGAAGGWCSRRRRAKAGPWSGTASGAAAAHWPFAPRTGTRAARDAGPTAPRGGQDLFHTIFAFGLSELQTFASFSADGVRGRIYGAGAGTGRRECGRRRATSAPAAR